jgi:hypothetical protein
MKKIILASLLALPTSVFADVSVSVSGIDYVISTQLTSYNSGQTLIQSQPWWGSSSLAEQFVAGIGNSFGSTMNGATGPLFAYANLSTWSYGGSGSRNDTGWSVSNNFYYASLVSMNINGPFTSGDNIVNNTIGISWKTGNININSTVTNVSYGGPVVGAFGSVGVLTNTVNGSITSGYQGQGISNDGGTISELTNLGSITSSNGAYGIVNARDGSIITINNSGTVSAAGLGIVNVGFITTLNNSGTISGTGSNSTGIYNSNSITTLNNSGTISGTDFSGAGVKNIGSITNLNNLSNGTINTGVYNGSGNVITSFINAGVINGDSQSSISNGGTIGTITNTGSMNHANGLADISNTISSGWRTSNGTIGVLNNGQGSAGSALTYSGPLASNYNIIISSANVYGQLSATNVTGNMAFNIYGYTGQTLTSGVSASSVINNHLYQNVLTGLVGTLSGSTITGTGFSIAGATGTYGLNNYIYTLLADDDHVSGTWDLLFGSLGPSVADTQSSIRSLASKLRGGFSSQAIATNFANMNTYDCNLFDTKGMCISAGGRYTTVDNPNSNSTSAVVVVGYKATPNIRIGGFLDQNVSNNTPTGINISNKNPLMGVFAVWNQNANGLGYQVKVANAYQDKDVNTTRDVIGTSEAGSGVTNLNTQSYVGELSYAFLTNQDKTTLRPYLALRQTTIKQDAYTETGVANPLSYGSLKDRSTTALVGLKLNHAVTPKATLTASFGIEQDLEHSVDQYSVTSSSIANLTSENFNDSIKRTRPVASAGAYYAVSKTQRISGNVFYQQLPFQSTGSTTAYFSYMIGL